MAKGNMFLGMSRGSVGDVTFYRGRGQQLARARNRNPKNPRSTAQVIQRMILATASKAYSRLKSITDHSFQGVSYGADSQSYFLKHAMDDIRTFVAANYPESSGSVQAAGFIGLAEPNFAAHSGIGLLISEGTLPSIPVSWSVDYLAQFGSSISVAEGSSPTVGQVMDSLGAIPGDQITLLALDDGRLLKSRYVISPDITTELRATAWSAAKTTAGVLSEYAETEGVEFYFDSAAGYLNVGEGDMGFLGVAVILSRKDGSSWLRSTQRLVLSYDSAEVAMVENGPSVVVPIWMAGTSGINVDSPYYLNNADD